MFWVFFCNKEVCPILTLTWQTEFLMKIIRILHLLMKCWHDSQALSEGHLARNMEWEQKSMCLFMYKASADSSFLFASSSFDLFTMMTSRKWRICSDLKRKNQKLVIPTSGTSLIGCTLSGSLRTKLRCTAVFNNLVKWFSPAVHIGSWI